MAFPNLFDPPDIEKLSYSDVTSYLEEKSGGEFICEICKSQSWFIGPLDEQIYGAIDVKSSDQEITSNNIKVMIVECQTCANVKFIRRAAIVKWIKEKNLGRE